MYRSEYDGLLRHAERVGHGQAEDVVQDAYLTFWRMLERSEIPEPRALLYKLTERKAIDYHRRQERRSEQEEPVGLTAELNQWAWQVPQTVEHVEFAERFDKAVRALPGEPRDALILTELRGLTDREAAPLLGASHMTIHRRAEAARRHVREEIA